MNSIISIVTATHGFNLKSVADGSLKLRATVVREWVCCAEKMVWGLKIEFSADGDTWMRVNHDNECETSGTLWGITNSYSESLYPSDPVLYPRTVNSARKFGDYTECRPSNNWTPALWHSLTAAIAELVGYGSEHDFNFEPKNEPEQMLIASGA